MPHADINLCTIRPDLVRWQDRIALPMDPGDVLVFHSLIHHYTAANRSDLRRRALQFHYHQVGLEWTSLEAHRALYPRRWRGICGLYRAERSAVHRSVQFRAQQVAADPADGLVWHG